MAIFSLMLYCFIATIILNVIKEYGAYIIECTIKCTIGWSIFWIIVLWSGGML